MRKILISHGYGSGWVSWHDGSDEERKFMLEYAPFIAALENNTESLSTWPTIENIPKCLTAAIEIFKVDWELAFPDSSLPSLLGLIGLTVVEVDDALVMVTDRDGYESYELRYVDGWL